MLELKIGAARVTYETAPVNAVINSPEYKGTFTLRTTFYASDGYTAVCGTQRLANISGNLTAGSVTGPDSPKIDFADYKCAGAAAIFKEWLRKNKLMPQIRDALLKTVVDYCIAVGPQSHWMFGGRVNLSLKQYASQFGVYCGSLAGYIARNKLGTLTASHVHQNKVHRAKSDYSMQQFFVWSPPGSLVLKSDTIFVGISENEEQVERSKKAFKEIGFAENSSLLKPRYVKGVKKEQFDLFEQLEEEKAA